VKEIRMELAQLNEKIREANKTMSMLMGEKTRIETRVEFMSKHYLDFKDAQSTTCPLCIIQ
jgi:hypothetical protein